MRGAMLACDSWNRPEMGVLHSHLTLSVWSIMQCYLRLPLISSNNAYAGATTCLHAYQAALSISIMYMLIIGVHMRLDSAWPYEVHMVLDSAEPLLPFHANAPWQCIRPHICLLRAITISSLHALPLCGR